MRVKLLIGLAVPLVFASPPAMAFGLLGLIGSIAGAAIGTGGGAALSSVGSGPAGHPGATSFSPAMRTGRTGGTAWATTGSRGEFTSLLPSAAHEVPRAAMQVPHFGPVHGSPDTLDGLGRPLPTRRGVDVRTVGTCRHALARAVTAHGAVKVDAASAGRPSHRSSVTFAPLTARVIYRLPSGFEVKQGAVTCHISRSGVAVFTR